jgi:hypothetical protein
MRKLNDEEIRGLLEKGEGLQDYQVLYEALGAEPPLGLSYNFATAVTAKIQARAARKFYLLMAVIIILVPGIVMGALLILNMQYVSQLLTTVLHYKWVFIFSAGIFILIQFLDQKYVKPTLPG